MRTPGAEHELHAAGQVQSHRGRIVAQPTEHVGRFADAERADSFARADDRARVAHRVDP